MASWPEGVNAVARGESLNSSVTERWNSVIAQRCPPLLLNDDPVGEKNHFSQADFNKTNDKYAP